MIKHYFKVSFSFLILLGTISCSHPTSSESKLKNTSNIRVFHALSSDAKYFVGMGDYPAHESVEKVGDNTNYFNFKNAGTISVFGTNTQGPKNKNTLWEFDIPIDVNKFYTAVLLGSSDAVENIIVEDMFADVRKPDRIKKTYVKVVNLVDGLSGEAQLGEESLGNLEYKQASSYVDIASGDASLSIGDFNASVTLKSQSIQTIYIVKDADGNSQVILASDSGS